MELELWNKRAT